MKNKYLLVILLTLIFSCQQNTTSKNNLIENNNTLNDSLDKKLQIAYKKGAIVGFSTAIVNNKEIVYDKGFGFTDVDLKNKYTSSTTQNIASISKTLIGISLLKAQELEKLNLNDPINNYLPFKIINPNFPDEPILIKHLAYHTSSINDLDEIYSKSYVLKKSKHDENEGVYDWFSYPKDKTTLTEYLKNSLTPEGKWYSKNSFSNKKPGTERNYSNIGAALCAEIIENATGINYKSFTKKHILKPLKMTSSGWNNKDIDSTKRSRLFANKDMVLAEYSLITYADGGFITSSKDLSLFLIELINGYKGNGTLLNNNSYKLLFEKKDGNNQTGENFGLFMEYTNNFIKIKDSVIGHNGSDPGVTTAMYFNPKTETGKILLINTDSDFDENYWPEVVSIWNALINYENKLNK